MAEGGSAKGRTLEDALSLKRLVWNRIDNSGYTESRERAALCFVGAKCSAVFC
ncbi:MAG: hypothetical protein HFI90_00515 [Clostridia bacterium]|nr:hypothetical protein [Clostridia bacterium]